MTYITQQLEERRAKDKITDKLKERLWQDGDVPYEIHANENTSCASLPGKRKASFKRNRVASAPNLKEMNFVTKNNNESIALNSSKVKFLSPDEKEPAVEKTVSYTHLTLPTICSV